MQRVSLAGFDGRECGLSTMIFQSLLVAPSSAKIPEATQGLYNTSVVNRYL